MRDTPAPIVIDHHQIVAVMKQHFEITAELVEVTP
jgi:hypothetical protein